jgi:uncharacterized protein YndB with AHSA1/START domain
MLTARFELDFDAGIDRVWAILIDYPGYARFPHVRSARVVEPGADHPAGVGAVRELDVDGITFRERIVEFDPPHVLAYRITESRPLPLVHDIGRMVLSERAGKTHLVWETTFTVGLPVVGRFLAYPVRAGMRRTFGRILRWVQQDLAREV